MSRGLGRWRQRQMWIFLRQSLGLSPPDLGQGGPADFLTQGWGQLPSCPRLSLCPHPCWALLISRCGCPSEQGIYHPRSSLGQEASSRGHLSLVTDPDENSLFVAGGWSFWFLSAFQGLTNTLPGRPLPSFLPHVWGRHC